MRTLRIELSGHDFAGAKALDALIGAKNYYKIPDPIGVPSVFDRDVFGADNQNFKINECIAGVVRCRKNGCYVSHPAN